MFLRCRCLIAITLLACAPRPPSVLGAGDHLGHCQKSGCRDSSDVDGSTSGGGSGGLSSSSSGLKVGHDSAKNKKYMVPGGSVKVQPHDFDIIRETHEARFGTGSHKMKPRLHLATLALEWIAVFLFLRFVLFVKYNGWKPVRRRLRSVGSSVRVACESAYRSACEFVGHEISRVRYRNSRVRHGVMGSFVSRGSAASLGSLVDLIGYDAYDERSEAPGENMNSSDHSVYSSSTYTSYYSGTDDDDSRTRYDDSSTITSFTEGSLVSTGAVLRREHADGRGRRYDNKYHDSGDDSYTAGSEPSSASESVLSKFTDYLRKKKGKKKDGAGGGAYRRENSRGSSTSGNVGRFSAGDEPHNQLRNAVSRPLVYRGRQSYDNRRNTSIEDTSSQRSASTASTMVRSVPAGNGRIGPRNNLIERGNDDDDDVEQQQAPHWPISVDSEGTRSEGTRDRSMEMMSKSLHTIESMSMPSSAQESGQSSREDRSMLETLLDSETAKKKKVGTTTAPASGGVSTGLSVSDSMTEVNLMSVAPSVQK